MAAYGHSNPMAMRAGQQAYPTQAPSMPVQSAVGPPAPAGTFSPGTKIQVGSLRVVIQKYLSEGGFAHVYLVKLPQPIAGTDLAVLKRVAVPDKETLRGMRTEVETMKRLKGHKHIVTYIDSHASEMRGGGYEVFLLMEYCNGGGLIDFMNTRLQHRLTEPEILNIFADVAEGVACMHYLKPPLLHRDLKVENVLITAHGSKKRFKVCDFGSAAPPRPAPTTVAECRLMDEDVQKHTTLQYRSPEMVDVYRKQPIDEKSDIWALGVLLYKLCYYTTPFEEQGQLAIMNASFRFPSHPVFSDRLKRLIASMLKEKLQARPNIYQVVLETCAMQGRAVPIQDIYSGTARTEVKGGEKTKPLEAKAHPAPVVGASFSKEAPQQQALPDIVPMRRGRPQAASVGTSHDNRSSTSPRKVTNGDPFAALDAKKLPGPVDELSSRFPTLDQFSLLHDHGSKFDFDVPTTPTSQTPAQQKLNEQVSHRLADEAFAIPSSTLPSRTSAEPTRPTANAPNPTQPPTHLSKTIVSAASPKPIEISKAQAIIKNNPELRALSSQPHQSYSPPKRPIMVSKGTMTSDSPPNEPVKSYHAPIHHFPPADQARPVYAHKHTESVPPRHTRLDDRLGALSSSPSLPSQLAQVSTPSPRISMEGGRPRGADLIDMTGPPQTTAVRQRPVSAHLESTMDFLREKELAGRGHPSPRLSARAMSPAVGATEDTNIESNVDFLRNLEESEPKRKEKPLKNGKKPNLAAMPGSKHIFAGKFSDAFKRFESNGPQGQLPPPRTPSPLKSLERRDLTPPEDLDVAHDQGEAGQLMDDNDSQPPEVRRELERRRLEEEERRVEAAQAEYRQRLAQKDGPMPLPKSIGGVSRAVSIQNRVQSLLGEDQKSSTNVPRTAQGYGKYTDTNPADGAARQAPELSRKPIGSGPGRPIPTAAPSARSSPGPKPVAPKKPIHLNNMPTGQMSGSPPLTNRPWRPAAPSTQTLMAVDLPGQPVIDMSAIERDEYISDFSKRFPSLGAIEMVERDISGSGRGTAK